MEVHESVINKIGAGRLVVSCQPVAGGAMDTTAIVVAMARAAEAGGAAALRIEGAARVKAVKLAVSIPVIGIIKHGEEAIFITPFLKDIDALANAGADLVAFDATRRPRPVSVLDLSNYAHSLGLICMADCSDLADGEEAAAAGCEIIGTTLSGYINVMGSVPERADFELIRQMADCGLRVMAEGRIHTPADAAKAIASGAWAVTVGTALTRLELTTNTFAKRLATDKDETC